MNKLYAVAKYELILDLRRRKGIAVFALVIFFAICYSYIIPRYANGAFFTYRPYDWDWMYTISEEFDSIVAGLFGLITGSLLALDAIAGEFEDRTISRLYSLPLRRFDIYAGKFVEKAAIIALFSLITIILSI
ncbi:ABC transporter permease [Thermoplasma sp.]|uniref:ABC transporter permease n=1 Tax=Thermoplasma sp. TaxID=1973142 RepID=UPI00128A309A|nr:ABC transporter permease [Thermoplasma sp.]KAA8922164.1 MAG: ABC transporter permease [Thermoplasma sp.]